MQTVSRANVSPIRRAAILRDHQIDQRLRHTSAECADVEHARQARRWAAMEDAAREAQPVLSHGQRSACAISAWMFFGAVWLMTGFFFGYSAMTLVGLATGLA